MFTCGKRRLVIEKIFKNVWIQPAAGDAGGALGAALLTWHQLLNKERKVGKTDSQTGSLLGCQYSNDDIKSRMDAIGAKYNYFEKDDDLTTTVGGCIADQKVIGWFSGRMEFGPRALGARSIIGDARSEEMQTTMNLKIKYRESFRPFAPCVLAEDVNEYFDLDEESPYMLIVAPVQDKIRKELNEEQKKIMTNDADLRKRVNIPRSTIPAITHIDYSARVQTVDKERHGKYYDVIKKFKEITGCSVIINTSFNIRGEPIVCTPEDAYRCFMNTEMDVLVLENVVLYKEEQPQKDDAEREAYKKSFKLD